VSEPDRKIIRPRTTPLVATRKDVELLAKVSGKVLKTQGRVAGDPGPDLSMPPGNGGTLWLSVVLQVEDALEASRFQYALRRHVFAGGLDLALVRRRR
jgi:hypothetical protein